MIVERYPYQNEVVDNSIPNYEMFSLLDGKTSQVVKCLLCLKIYKIYEYPKPIG
jgi:hypothetical protein